jgi:hypothetical protein
MMFSLGSPKKKSDVQELEQELSNIRSAFEDYINSSKELEDGLDCELGDMSKFTRITLTMYCVSCRFNLELTTLTDFFILYYRPQTCPFSGGQ